MPIKEGDIFGRLTAIARLSGKRQFWLFQCSCGNKKSIYYFSVINGDTRSCGCLRKDVVSAKRTTHGMSKTSVYDIWNGMLSRCYNPKNSSYHRYGKRGIEVCERWHKFEYFLADMGLQPKNHSIERKNNNGDYEPTNCEWIPQTRQALNRRNTVLINFQGKTLTATDWEKITGIKRNTIRQRFRRGMSVERVLSKDLS